VKPPNHHAAAGFDGDFGSSGLHPSDVGKTFTRRRAGTRMLASFGSGFRPVVERHLKTPTTIFPESPEVLRNSQKFLKERSNGD
jgi:hypothetical protein